MQITTANTVLKSYMRQLFDGMAQHGMIPASKPAAPKSKYELALEEQKRKQKDT